MKPPVRTAPSRGGPANQSRAAGAPTPASAAATAATPSRQSPGAGNSFYDTGAAPAAVQHVPGQAASPLEAASSMQAEHVASVGDRALSMGDGLSADVDLSPEFEGRADEAATLAADIERIGKMRRPLGEYQQKLALAPRRGYHRHWFNDTAGRVDEAKANGWAHVKGSDGINEKRVVGSGRHGGELHAYAMEIPEVFWLEDMKAKTAMNNRRMDALKASPFKAQAGTMKASDKGKFYSPVEEPLTVDQPRG